MLVSGDNIRILELRLLTAHPVILILATDGRAPFPISGYTKFVLGIG